MYADTLYFDILTSCKQPKCICVPICDYMACYLVELGRAYIVNFCFHLFFLFGLSPVIQPGLSIVPFKAGEHLNPSRVHPGRYGSCKHIIFLHHTYFHIFHTLHLMHRNERGIQI